MSNTWIISDTHWMHEKIIGYCNRPFKNAGEMDEVMIKRWNERVKPGDLVYHLGDVGLTKEDKLKPIIARLNGKKILILGNHDKSAERMMDFGFDFACDSMVIRCMNHVLFLNHKPLQFKPPFIGIDLVLHGHIHNSTPESRLEHVSKGELVNIPSFNVNLSVEVINYEPVSLPWVVKTAVHRERQGLRM
jgi:calcineurin-like phosphoesterase family protein